MRMHEWNEKAMAALGIRSISWMRNRRHEADWRVIFNDGKEMTITTHIFCTETSVIREVGRILQKEDHPIRYGSAVQS